MKIRVEIDPKAPEEEIVLHCRELTPEVVKLQQLLAKQIKSTGQIILYQNDTEYYLETDRILFFETEGSQVLAHTETEIFEARKKLYELEDMLGSDFLRISKSAIVNLNRIYAIRRNLAASSEISFQGTHKQIYVSRAYHKSIKGKIRRKEVGKMKKTSRIFWGLGFITAAVFLVLKPDASDHSTDQCRSALIGILCAALLVSSIADRSFGGIFFSLGLAWLTFAEVLGLPKVGFGMW